LFVFCFVKVGIIYFLAKWNAAISRKVAESQSFENKKLISKKEETYILKVG
jgi:hypothetical protein